MGSAWGGLHPGECLHPRRVCIQGGSASGGIVCIKGGVSLHQGGSASGEGGASRGVYIRRLGRPPLADATGYSQ